MRTPEILLICLCSGVILLEIVKQILLSKEKYQYGIDIGTCMTIGDRELQEDNLDTMITESGILAVLADGMGKAYGGRIASRIAVETFLELFKEYNAFDNPQYYFRKAFHCANKEILKALEDERRGAASVGVVMIRDHKLYYAVVGNVKIFIFREGDLVPVSTGHTLQALAEEKFLEGKISRQDALTMLENHRLFNYIGQDGFQEVELFDEPISLKKEDQILLVSDGIYDILDFPNLEETLLKKTNSQTKALEIIEQVNAQTQKKKDNASIILLKIGRRN